MKKVMIIGLTLTSAVLFSCSNADKPEEAVEKTKTIVVEKEPKAVPPKDETSISIDKDGVSFSKKDGNTEVDIDLKDKK